MAFFITFGSAVRCCTLGVRYTGNKKSKKAVEDYDYGYEGDSGDSAKYSDGEAESEGEGGSSYEGGEGKSASYSSGGGDSGSYSSGGDYSESEGYSEGDEY